MDRVVITKAMVGICHMQVCAERGITDEEILMKCNSENPSGTSGGWSVVVREVDGGDGLFDGEGMLPVDCGDSPGRLHILVGC